MKFPDEILYNIDSIPVYLSRRGLVYCGDCIKILRQFPSCSIDLIVTDPPYGIAYNRNGTQVIRNDTRNKATALFDSLLIEAARILKPGRCLVTFCFSGGKSPIFPNWIRLMERYLEYKNTIVWNKGSIGRGAHYRHQYDLILVAKRRGKKCLWNGDYNVSNIIMQPRASVGELDHPTPKPVELLKHFIRLHSNKGEIVVDPFAGHGSTLMAAFALGVCRDTLLGFRI